MLHSCDNPSCVRPDHLFEGTQQDNMDDKVRKGRTARGVKHGLSRLTYANVASILSSSLSTRALAKVYRVAQSTVARVKQGKTWAHAS